MSRTVSALALTGLALLAGVALLRLGDGVLTAAPDVAITSLDGATTRLDQWRGRPVLVTFWSVDCPGCLRDMPRLAALHADFAARGLEVVGIAMPWNRPDHVLAMARGRNLPYRIGLDIDGRVTAAFGRVDRTPTSFLIDPDGRIRYHTTGEIDIDKVRTLVAAMLAAPAAGRTARLER